MQSIAWAADSFTFACMRFLAITLAHNMVIQSRNKLTKFINCLFYGKLWLDNFYTVNCVGGRQITVASFSTQITLFLTLY